MSTKARAKVGVRSGKGKGGRRAQVAVKRGRDLPILPFAVLGVLVVFAIGIIVYLVINNKPTPGPATAAGIPCDQLEHTQVHYHAALQIIYHGNATHLTPNLGIVGDPAAPTCYYWLHVHPANQDVVHIESPASQTFTLGQFFSVWNAWNKIEGVGTTERLDATHVASFTLSPEDSMVVYIDLQDGKGAQKFTGDPKAIVLKSHEVITIEITPPEVAPPPAFTFTSGL